MEYETGANPAGRPTLATRPLSAAAQRRREAARAQKAACDAAWAQWLTESTPDREESAAQYADANRLLRRQLTAAAARNRIARSRADRAARASVGRTPRSRGAGRPRAQAARSSARSGDSGSDDPDQDESDAAPPAAHEAVARVFEQILRERHPGVAWEVRP